MVHFDIQDKKANLPNPHEEKRAESTTMNSMRFLFASELHKKIMLLLLLSSYC